MLADALDIPRSNIIPFDDWIQRVRHFSGSVETENPAGKLIEFLEDNFLRMSCGGLILDVTKTKEHSRTLRNEGPVSAELARKYVRAWMDMGVLAPKHR